LGLDLVMLPPLVIGLPDSVCSRYVIIDPDWGADHWFEGEPQEGPIGCDVNASSSDQQEPAALAVGSSRHPKFY
jgi:hypothetical protein